MTAIIIVVIVVVAAARWTHYDGIRLVLLQLCCVQCFLFRWVSNVVMRLMFICFSNCPMCMLHACNNIYFCSNIIDLVCINVKEKGHLLHIMTLQFGSFSPIGGRCRYYCYWRKQISTYGLIQFHWMHRIAQHMPNRERTNGIGKIRKRVRVCVCERQMRMCRTE